MKKHWYQVVFIELAIGVPGDPDDSEKTIKERARQVIGHQKMLDQQLVVSKCKPVYLGDEQWQVPLKDVKVGEPVEVLEMPEEKQEREAAIDIIVTTLGLSSRAGLSAVRVDDR